MKCKHLGEIFEKVFEPNSVNLFFSFTAADCVIGFTLYWAHTIEDGILLEDYPILRSYLQRLQSRPSFQRTFGDDDSWSWKKVLSTSLQAIQSIEA